MWTRSAFPLLLALLFLSGACSLTYQILWLRQLSLIFGVTVYAASTVLAAFMTGLAVGSWLAGRVLARSERRPIAFFGVAEIAIAICALATPLSLDAATQIYAAVHRWAPESFGVLTVTRVLCSFAVLLVPTLLMGFTLPLVSGSAAVRGSRFGSRVGALYAANTAGAVAGVLLTGYHLIGAIGMQRTFWLAATINVTVGLVALLLSRQVEGALSSPLPAVDRPSGDLADPGTVGQGHSGRDRRLVLGLVFVSGFASLALEIVWFRTLVQYLTATTYAFTTMLATVLGGIATGGMLAARVLRSRRDWLSWLVALQAATGAAALLSMWFLAWSYGRGWRTSATIQASIAAILPATILMGLSFPLTLRLGSPEGVLGSSAAVARSVGHLYAANTAGAVVGSLAGGFLLVPWLGVHGALLTLAAVYLASGLILAGWAWTPRRFALAASLGVFAVAAAGLPDPFAAAIARRHGKATQEVWRDEGIQTAVSVHTTGDGRALFLDGLHQANDTPEMVTLHRTIGHLPMMLHPSPADALVVGLGGGATAGAVSRHAEASVEVVELSDGVRRAADFFRHVNDDVLNAANVRLRVDDGRNFLTLTPRTFDVITADIIQPIHAGAGNLYSREYYGLLARALRDDGIVLQWVGHRPDHQYKLILRTFLSVFPQATLWFDGTLMVGSRAPLKLSRAVYERRLQDPALRAALQRVGLASFAELTSRYTAGPDEMRRFVGDGPLLTDDRPLMEYHRSLPADRPADLSALRGSVTALLDGS